MSEEGNVMGNTPNRHVDGDIVLMSYHGVGTEYELVGNAYGDLFEVRVRVFGNTDAAQAVRRGEDQIDLARYIVDAVAAELRNETPTR